MNNQQLYIIIALAVSAALWFYTKSMKPKNNGTTEVPGARQSRPSSPEPVTFETQPVAMESGTFPQSVNPNISNGRSLQESIQKPVLRVN